MTLNATLPADSDMVSVLPSKDREERLAINALQALVVAGSGPVFTTLNCAAQSTLTVGVDISAAFIEIISITSIGASAIDEIAGGSEGQIKIFWIQDADVTFAYQAAKLILNQPVHITPYGSLGDIICFFNVGGDPTTLTDGYWQEMFRTPAA